MAVTIGVPASRGPPSRRRLQTPQMYRVPGVGGGCTGVQMSLVVEWPSGFGQGGGGASVHPVDCLASPSEAPRPGCKLACFFDQRRCESLVYGVCNGWRRRPVPTRGARDLAAMAKGGPAGSRSEPTRPRGASGGRPPRAPAAVYPGSPRHIRSGVQIGKTAIYDDPNKRDLAARMAELARTVAARAASTTCCLSVTATAKELIPGWTPLASPDRHRGHLRITGPGHRSTAPTRPIADAVQRRSVRQAALDGRSSCAPTTSARSSAGRSTRRRCGDRRTQWTVVQAVHCRSDRRCAQLVRVSASKCGTRKRRPSARCSPPTPQRRYWASRHGAAGIGAVHQRPHRPGQGHHHGALQGR